MRFDLAVYEPTQFFQGECTIWYWLLLLGCFGTVLM